MPVLLLTQFPVGVATGVIGTTKMQLPINCILASDSLYKRIINDNQVVPFRKSESVAASASSVRRLSGGPPSFTVKTSTRGYD